MNVKMVQNGSKCISFGSSYECKCLNDGYSGKYCENCNFYIHLITKTELFHLINLQ